MGNHCYAAISIEGEKGHLDRFIEKAKGYSAALLIGEEPDPKYASCLDFNQFIPVPAEFLTDEHTRFDWCRKYWLTRFSPFDASLHRDSDTSVVYNFSTINGTPFPVVFAMGQQFPMLRFFYSYGDPLGGFEGEWKCENGVMTGEHRRMPDGWRDSPEEPVDSTQEPSPVHTECGAPEISDADVPF